MDVQAARHDVVQPVVQPLDLAARVLANMPPAKSEAAATTGSVSAVSEPDTRPIHQPPLVLAPQSLQQQSLPQQSAPQLSQPQQAVPARVSQARDPLVVSDVERAELAEIPSPGAEPAPPSPSLLARSGQLVKRAVGSIGSVFHRNDQ
jgi:hypothetical protein